MPPAGLVTRPDGRDGVDPVTGQPAVWIHADGREVAELAGCRVLDASAVVAGHFGEIVANHADELLTREQVERLLERVRSTAPSLVGEVVPGLLRAGELQRVLQNLLAGTRQHPRPGDDPRDVGRPRRPDQGHRRPDRAGTPEPCPTDHRDLPRARRASASRHARPPLEDRLAAAGSQSETRPAEALGEDTARSIIRAAAVAVGTLVDNGYPPVILTAPAARALLKDLTRADLPRLVVLGQREIPRDTPVEILGSVIEEEPESVMTTFMTTH